MQKLKFYSQEPLISAMSECPPNPPTPIDNEHVGNKTCKNWFVFWSQGEPSTTAISSWSNSETPGNSKGAEYLNRSENKAANTPAQPIKFDSSNQSLTTGGLNNSATLVSPTLTCSHSSAHDGYTNNHDVLTCDLLTESRLSSEILSQRVKEACTKLPKSITTGILLSVPSSKIIAASLSVGTLDNPLNDDCDGGEQMRRKKSMLITSNKHIKKGTKIGSSLAPMLSEQLGFAAHLGKAKKETVAGMKLLSEDGLVFRSHLKDKEYVFLNASEFGEVEVVKELLCDPSLNVDCVDYMGRNAILLAMKTENIELIGCLVDKLNFFAVEDALLNAISQEKIHIVKLIIDHPQYIRMEKIMTPRGQRAGIITKSIERSQFSSDITPLMLAAHTNNHEIIQLLLDRALEMEMPHDRTCICLDCECIRAQVRNLFQ